MTNTPFPRCPPRAADGGSHARRCQQPAQDLLPRAGPRDEDLPHPRPIPSAQHEVTFVYLLCIVKLWLRDRLPYPSLDNLFKYKKLHSFAFLDRCQEVGPPPGWQRAFCCSQHNTQYARAVFHSRGQHLPVIRLQDICRAARLFGDPIL